MQFGATTLFLLVGYAVADEKACPPTEVVKFAELYANPHLHPCQKASDGFSLAPPMGYPTEAQVKAMCSSDACLALIKDVLALKPDDCYLSFAGIKLNAYKLSYNFEDSCKSEKNHESGKDEPTEKPTDDKHHETPKPTEDKHYPTPKPTEDKYHKTPKPTEDKQYPTPKPTEDKHDSTSKPTEGKYDPTPKPTEEKHYPTPKPTKKDHHEPMLIKDDNKEMSCSKDCAEKETANEADAKPPIHATADEFYPMPNTTYKATTLPKA